MTKIVDPRPADVNPLGQPGDADTVQEIAVFYRNEEHRVLLAVRRRAGRAFASFVNLNRGPEGDWHAGGKGINFRDVEISRLREALHKTKKVIEAAS